MCSWNVDTIQNSTVSDNILLFIDNLYLDDPYNFT